MSIRKWYNWIFCRKVALENEELRARLAETLNFIRNAPVSSGVCCCGDSMENHANPYDCGHSPVDQWDNSVAGLIEVMESSLQGANYYQMKILSDPHENPWKRVIIEKLIQTGAYSPQRHDNAPMMCMNDIVGKAHGTIKGCVDLKIQADILADLLEEAIRGIQWYIDTFPSGGSGADDEFIEKAETALKAYNVTSKRNQK